jgi:hypothetical protein
MDKNGDGVRDTTEGERDLCQAVSDDDFVATCTFTVTNPPFVPGFFGTGGSCELGATVDCNFINGIDGRKNTTLRTLGAFSDPQERFSFQTYELRGLVSASPRVGIPGDTITVQLRDFEAGSTIAADPADRGEDRLDLAGTDITLITTVTVNANGAANFTMDIPNGVALGRQSLQVKTSSPIGQPTRRTTITIGGANITLSHELVIANQDLTISGNGFTQSTEEVCVREGDITISAIILAFDDTNDCSTGVLAGAARGIRLSSGGTFTVTVRVHVPGKTIDASLLTEGPHELKVIDSTGTEGNLVVIIGERTLEVTPTTARPRDIINIIGRNYPADNPDGASVRVDVEYDCGGGNTRVVSADTDVSGNFRESLRIPSGCAIPSTNTIRADIGDGITTVIETDTVTHEIPLAFVSVTPGRGSEGTLVTIAGEGFRTFTEVDNIRIGGLSALGNRNINTDSNGNFLAEGLLVPGLDPGIHAVRVDIGSSSDPNRVTATSSYEVLEAGVVGIPTPLPEALDPLGDNLVRAFHFNNVSKVWTFYDPRPEFADANTLSELVSNAVYWVRINEDVDVDLNLTPRNLSCVDEDCWNLIVY